MQNFIDKLKKPNWKHAVIAGLGIFASYAICKSGVFKKVDVKETKYAGGQYLYFEVQSDYKNLGTHYQQLYREYKASFPNSKMFSIHFDDPCTVKDVNQCRSVVGFIVSNQDKQNVDTFLKQNIKYKSKILLQVDTVQAVWGYNFFSFFTIHKVYAALWNAIDKNHKAEYIPETGSIGEYDEQNQELKAMFCYGDNSKSYAISTISVPPKKQ